jgi:hypothetical protein
VEAMNILGGRGGEVNVKMRILKIGIIRKPISSKVNK